MLQEILNQWSSPRAEPMPYLSPFKLSNWDLLIDCTSRYPYTTLSPSGLVCWGLFLQVLQDRYMYMVYVMMVYLYHTIGESQMDGWMIGWVGGWMVGWVDGWMPLCHIRLSLSLSLTHSLSLLIRPPVYEDMCACMLWILLLALKFSLTFYIRGIFCIHPVPPSGLNPQTPLVRNGLVSKI